LTKVFTSCSSCMRTIPFSKNPEVWSPLARLN